MKEKYQSLTVALDHVTSTRDPSPRTGTEQLKKQRDVVPNQKVAKKAGKKGGERFDLSKVGIKKKFTLKKISSQIRTDQERSVQLRTIELKKYLAHLTTKHTAQILASQGKNTTDYNGKTGLSTKKPSFNSVKFKQKQYKVTHSLPHIPAATAGDLQTPLHSRRSVRLDSEALPTRLTAYGLASLQERIYKIDTSYRHAPFTYHSSSYGHPYVSDELFERITEWIRRVNISVDWASVVQSASDEVLSFHD